MPTHFPHFMSSLRDFHVTILFVNQNSLNFSFYLSFHFIFVFSAITDITFVYAQRPPPCLVVGVLATGQGVPDSNPDSSMNV